MSVKKAMKTSIYSNFDKTIMAGSSFFEFYANFGQSIIDFYMYKFKNLAILSCVFILIGLANTSCKKQKLESLSITDFSPNHVGVIEYFPELNEETTNIEKDASISILNLKGDTLIKVASIINTELDLPYPDSIKSNETDSPFGFQSLIIYNDFNCDGINDFAIKTGNNGCYGAPSYNIYLGKEKGTFTYNEAFSRLAQDFCGIFKYDCETKTIETYKKEGSVWNQFQTYDLVDGLPVLSKQVLFDNLYYPISVMLETHWINNSPSTRIQVGGDQIRAIELASFAFDREKEAKKVLLFESVQQESSSLYLFLVDIENYIIQDFPKLVKSEENSNSKNGEFTLTKNGKEQLLTFHGDQEYNCTLSLSPNKQTITISNNKTKYTYSYTNYRKLDVSLSKLFKGPTWNNLKLPDSDNKK